MPYSNARTRKKGRTLFFLRLVAIGACVGLLPPVVQAGVVWDDGFDGSPSPHWTIATVGDGASVSQAAGQMLMDTAIPADSARAQASASTDSTGAITTFNGARLYNFYDHSVSVRFDIASIAGAPNGPNGRNIFYFSIGDDHAGNFMLQDSLMDDGLGFRLEHLDAGVDLWRIYHSALVSGSATESLVAYLTGAPSALIYTLDGTNATVEVEGAAVSFPNWTASGNTLTGPVADLSANISTYNLAFGAYNLGTVSEATAVVLDAVRVEAYFNVLAYGAIPNDGEDDTAGIQAALDAAEVSEGDDMVYLPAGDYLAAMLRIGGDTVLRGAGSRGDAVAQLMMTDYVPHTFNILRNKNIESGDPNITIEKISFDGRKASQTNLFLHSVDMENVVGLRVDDCEFHNSQAIGLVVQGDLSVDSHTAVVDCTSTGNELGFYAQAKSDAVNGLRGVCYSNCVSRGDSWGFDAYLSKGVEYVGCTASDALEETARGFTSDSCIDLRYTNCLAQSNGTYGFAVYINLNNLQQSSNVVFTGCDALDNGLAGFHIENARDIALSDVRAMGNGIGIEAISSFREDRPVGGLMIANVLASDNQQHGIFLSGVRDSEIRGSVVTNNSRLSSGVYDGINIDDGAYWVLGLPSRNIRIVDNVVGASQSYGVRSVGGTDYVTLMDNDLASNLSGPYTLVGENNMIITSLSYAAWTDSWEIGIGSETNDYDGDRLSNLAEYALGGDPTNPADAGLVPTFGNNGGTMTYVYARYAGNNHLYYHLETTTDMLSAAWTNAGYSVVATSMQGGLFDYVTNTIPATTDQGFIRLRIESD